MYKESIKVINTMALSKKNLLEKSLIKYLLAAVLAGVYVSFAMVAVLTTANPFSEMNIDYTAMIMGLFFGVALILIMFAGAELFTGNNMIFSISTLSKKTSMKDLTNNWFWCYVGNFLGALLISGLIYFSGLLSTIGNSHILFQIAEKKMTLPIGELFVRGILCNWLVCLAIWTVLRTKNDMAKIAIMCALLFTFVVSGYEHSIANMSLLTLAVMHGTSETIHLFGLFYNLVPVTLGNIVGGSIFVGALYWNLDNQKSEVTETVKASKQNNNKMPKENLASLKSYN